MTKNNKKTLPIRILRWLVGIVAIAAVGFCILVAVLWVNEYTPEAIEPLEIRDGTSETVAVGDNLTVLSWNIGYCALGEEEDYFLDGGKNVNAKSKEEVEGNLSAIQQTIAEHDPDIVLIQEADRDSHRSFNVDQDKGVTELLPEGDSTFATNYKVLYVPYPGPFIGEVEAGLTTYSRFNICEADREALPCPFTFPWRLCNLKRCLSVNRIPVEGTDKELVIVNLHLEAYDSGEGKIAQTKQLKELLEKEAAAGNYVIAGGDFNQTFSNADTSAYPLVDGNMWQPGIIDTADFDGDFQFIMDTRLPSCRSLDKPYKGADHDNFQYYVIDGFIVSGNVTVCNAVTLDYGFMNSDHNPMLLNVTLN